MSSTAAELFLALKTGDVVRCERCARVVDLEKSCELLRSGHRQPLRVTRCHDCLTERPSREVAIDAWVLAGELVAAYGPDGAKKAIESALFLPAPGSHWVYSDQHGADVNFQFQFVRHVGELLQFSGPFGEWVCRREDWIHHLAFQRVRSFHPSTTESRS